MASTIEAIGRADPWQTVDFDDVEVRELGDGAAMLIYQARASRGDADEYVVLVSTLYTNNGGTWKLLTHQQTPLQKA